MRVQKLCSLHTPAPLIWHLAGRLAVQLLHRALPDPRPALRDRAESKNKLRIERGKLGTRRVWDCHFLRAEQERSETRRSPWIWAAGPRRPCTFNDEATDTLCAATR